MKAPASALVLALGLLLATATGAAVIGTQTPPTGDRVSQGHDPNGGSLPPPVKWLPAWLKQPLSRAIADATDPRPRK